MPKEHTHLAQVATNEQDTREITGIWFGRVMICSLWVVLIFGLTAMGTR